MSEARARRALCRHIQKATSRHQPAVTRRQRAGRPGRGVCVGAWVGGGWGSG